MDPSQDPSPNGTYASGADGVMIRGVLRKSIAPGWSSAIVDIKTAFLTAPRTEIEGRKQIVVKPPQIMVDLGVCGSDEYWQVEKALYGFVSSPAWWALHRDSQVKDFQWFDGDVRFFMESTAEVNLWRVMAQGPGETLRLAGLAVVYVDDILVTGEGGVCQGFIDQLRRVWKVSEPEWVNQNQWVRFCGFELRRTAAGELMIGQPSYTRELLKRHGTTQCRTTPISKADVLDEEEIEADATPTQVRQQRGSPSKCDPPGPKSTNTICLVMVASYMQFDVHDLLQQVTHFSLNSTFQDF